MEQKNPDIKAEISNIETVIEELNISIEDEIKTFLEKKHENEFKANK